MIRARNTVELEKNYKLSQIDDEEQVVIKGGLDKEKYNRERYERRVTYSGRDIKNIITKMREIEANIPDEWNDWQKAKYIYETIGKNVSYDYKYFEAGRHQQDSNLTTILSGKAVCAGYALLFKEMMDRQNIECEYIRGEALGNNNNPEKHAWNNITIDGKTIALDVTWDSARISKGAKIEYFGNNTRFNERHVADLDERQFNYFVLSDEDVKSINTNISRNDRVYVADKMDLETKRVFVENAIDETYKKYSKLQGIDKAKEQVKAALRKYVEEGYSKYFTNNGGARDNIQKYVSQGEMSEIVSNIFVDSISRDEKFKDKREALNEENILRKATKETLEKYNKEQAVLAIKRYINQDSPSGFTNSANRAELTIKDKDVIMNNMYDNIVEYTEISRERENETKELIREKNCYNSYELQYIAQKEKSKGVLNECLDWMVKKKEKDIEKEEIDNLQKIANDRTDKTRINEIDEYKR